MGKLKVFYEGRLRCRVEGNPGSMVTDSPAEYGGRAEELSPTDALVAALGTCMLTTMAIVAEKAGCDMQGTTIDITKQMSTGSPRRIASMDIGVHLPAGIPQQHRGRIEAAMRGCPVGNSLHPEIKYTVRVQYSV